MSSKGTRPPDSASELAACVRSLIHDGRVLVSARPTDDPDADALPMLEELDALARAEDPLDFPVFSPAAALWGARLFHQLCRFILCRDLGEDQINAACAVPCPETRCPSTDWSVDLTLHHLPRLFELARHLSNADPLIGQMEIIAAAWPLSSVGIAGLENLRLDSFVVDAALRRLYADRITAAGETSRLGNPNLDDMLRADLGIHHELAPAIAAKLFETQHDTD